MPEWQLEDAARLKDLYDDCEGKPSQAEFGDTYGIGSQGMVWQYLHGHRPLNIDAAVSFARGLNVGIRDFSPTIAEKILDAAKFVEKRKNLNTTGDKHFSGQASSPVYAWLSAEEMQLITLYRTTSERERGEIMREALASERTIQLPILVNNKL